jgi:hypothetical protein
MKVVINACYGGFGLSYEGVMDYARRKGIKLYAFVDDGAWDLAKPKVPYDGTGAPPPGLGVLYYLTVPRWADREHEGAWWSERGPDRSDPALVATVESLGARAGGRFAELKVVEIPDGVEYDVEEYDGLEWVAERHRTWR